jgi:hypothetical protein
MTIPMSNARSRGVRTRLDPRPTGAVAGALACALMLAGICWPTDARADQGSPDFARLWQDALERLERASDALEPPLAPPAPRVVQWQAKRVSSVDLGAPLLALGTGDLDRDGQAEIVALTADELVILERRGRRDLQARARLPLPGRMAVIRPRDAVGSLVIADVDNDGQVEVVARSSERAHGSIARLVDGALVEVGVFDGFPLCPTVHGELDPGRNYFVTTAGAGTLDPTAAAPAETEAAAPESAATAGVAGAPVSAIRWRAFAAEKPERFFSARCRDDMVDAAGRKRTVVGILGNDGTLHLWSEVRCPRRDLACHAARARTRALADNGVAFEIADIDNNGHPEVVVTAAAPPGEPDRVSVLSWQDDRLMAVYQRSFSGGVVGLSAGDIDGDGALELLCAVRLFGSYRVDLWIFNR